MDERTTDEWTKDEWMMDEQTINNEGELSHREWIKVIIEVLSTLK